jgi:hypothetical protein
MEGAINLLKSKVLSLETEIIKREGVLEDTKQVFLFFCCCFYLSGSSDLKERKRKKYNIYIYIGFILYFITLYISYMKVVFVIFRR